MTPRCHLKIPTGRATVKTVLRQQIVSSDNPCRIVVHLLGLGRDVTFAAKPTVTRISIWKILLHQDGASPRDVVFVDSEDATPITIRVTHLHLRHGLNHHPQNPRGHHLARNKEGLCHGKVIRDVSIVDVWIIVLASMLPQGIHCHRHRSPTRQMPRQTGSGARVRAIGPRQMYSALQPTRPLLC